ncbi:MAG: amidinotransferase [Deltaproteobacteria bacterium]|nr:amidinotransferase [Deltaproteobacteria bacterium]
MIRSADLRAELSAAVLMVEPAHFAFNDETARDNSYMHPPGVDARAAAMAEFERATAVLADIGVEVIRLPGSADPMPDAVFPNNWLGTDNDGLVIVFPMKHPSRQRETAQLDAALLAFEAAAFQVEGVLRLDEPSRDAALEGTGSLVLDRRSSTIYAALSPRTDAGRVRSFARLRGFERVELFRATGREGESLYHTNVMMGLGRGFAVICPESIEDPADRSRVLRRLREDRDVIEVGRDTMNEAFACNVIGVGDRNGQQVVVMSRSAHEGFTAKDRDRLSAHGRLAVLDMPTIERIGGGSARCLVAEVFLPRVGRG